MQHAVESRQIHELFRALPRYGAGFVSEDLPSNGIYLFSEVGETAFGGNRIVRVGTHRGNDRLPKRLKLHFEGTARRSVFRRHVGNALIRAGMIPSISPDRASLAAKSFSTELEDAISARMIQTFTFSVLRVDDLSDRLRIETGLIASLAANDGAYPSELWLGRHSLVGEIQATGLWNQKHVSGAPLSREDFELVQKFARSGIVEYDALLR